MTKERAWAENQGHPSEMTLADFLERDLSDDVLGDVEAHLEHCAACREVIDHAGSELPVIAKQVGPASAPSPLLPEPVVARLRERSVEPPAIGQIWRLRVPVESDDMADLALLTVVDDDTLIAVPVTSDSRSSSDLWAWQATLDETDISVAVWLSLETAIGWEALDVYLGTVDRESLTRVHRAIRRGNEPPTDLPLGRAIDDELAAYRRQLQVRFAEFGNARLLPQLDAEADEEGGEDVVDVASAMEAAGWSLSRLVEVAGITPVDARKVRQGTRALNPEELQRVEVALGGAHVTTGPVRVEQGWIGEISRPVHRHRFERVAAAEGQDGWALRRREAQLPAAARGNRGSSADWATLVEQRLAALEAAAGIDD